MVKLSSKLLYHTKNTDQVQKLFPSFFKIKYGRRKIARDTNLLLTARNLSVQPTKIVGGKSISVWPIVGEKSVPAYSSEGEKSLETKEKSVPIVGKNVVSFEGKNPWDALRFARQLFTTAPNKNTSRFSESVIVVRPEGIEPPSTASKAAVLSVKLRAPKFYERMHI